MDIVVKVSINELARPTGAVASERFWKLMKDWLIRARRKRRNKEGITINIIRKVP